MSTVQATPRSLRRRIGLRSRLLAVSALVAVGAVALILALSGSNHATTPHPAIRGAQPWPRSTQPWPDTPLTAVTPAGPAGHFRNPDTPLTAVTPAGPSGHFRNPDTHELLRMRSAAKNVSPTRASALEPLTPLQWRYVHRIASLSEAQVAAAYGTGR
jgi:hypothetical protein